MRTAYKHVPEDNEGTMARLGSCGVEVRRWLWTTSSNLVDWFDAWRAFLLAESFAVDEPETQPDGSVAEVTIPLAKRRRIFNADETHDALDTDHDMGGSRAMSLVDKSRSRSGTRCVVATGHITGLYCVSASGENLTAMYFYSTDAQDPANF